ncbi:MAG: hypothetical protein QOE41_4561 [Mycobacterium sp.]|nr:hypothetical protein [Mycobacterium sp.]
MTPCPEPVRPLRWPDSGLAPGVSAVSMERLPGGRNPKSAQVVTVWLRRVASLFAQAGVTVAPWNIGAGVDRKGPFPGAMC